MVVMDFIEFLDNEVDALREVALQSIQCGLQRKKALVVDAQAYPENLQKIRATFVTLTKNEQLRGCIGTLTAVDALVVDVANHAFAAAFSDPRFPQLTPSELGDINFDISILTPAKKIDIFSEQECIDKVRPGIDGVILQEGYRQATFLPSVWDQLPEAKLFLQHLKQKAGMPADYWSDALQVSFYQAQKI
jgi:uncharacterized protein